MTVLYLGNALAILVATWAVWVRRDSFHSRTDAPITIAIALFALGTLLDSPWPYFGAASFPLTGKYYLLTAAGHVCYLLGAAMGLKTVWMRLLSDDALREFMSNRVRLMVSFAVLTMLTCAVMSPVTSRTPTGSLYQARPDYWLAAYWVAYFGTLTVLNAIAVYGGIQLSRDPRSVMVAPLVGATALGIVACLGLFVAILTGHGQLMHDFAWPGCYLAIIAGAVACAYSWRHRRTAFSTPG